MNKELTCDFILMVNCSHVPSALTVKIQNTQVYDGTPWKITYDLALGRILPIIELVLDKPPRNWYIKFHRIPSSSSRLTMLTN